MKSLILRKLKSALMTSVMALAILAVLIPLVLVFTYIVKMGFSSINLDFFTKIPKPPGEPGGGWPTG